MWDTVNQVGAVFGVLILLAGACGVAWSTFKSKQKQTLRDDNQDLTNRVFTLENLLDRERAENKAAQEAADLKIEGLQSKCDLLEEMVVQRANVDGIASNMKELTDFVKTFGTVLSVHHSESMEGLADIKEALEALPHDTTPQV